MDIFQQKKRIIIRTKNNNSMAVMRTFHFRVLLVRNYHRFGCYFRILFPLRTDQSDQRVYANESFVEIRHFEYFCTLFVVVFLTYGGQMPFCLQG